MNPFDELRAEIGLARANCAPRRVRYEIGLKRKVLKLLESYSEGQITKELGLGGATIHKWQKRESLTRLRKNSVSIESKRVMVTRAEMPVESPRKDRPAAAIFLLGTARIEVFEFELAKNFFAQITDCERP